MENSDLVTIDQLDEKFTEFSELVLRYSRQDVKVSEFKMLRNLDALCYSYGDMLRNISFKMERLNSLAQDHKRNLYICRNDKEITPLELRLGEAIIDVFKESSEVGQRYARKCVKTMNAKIWLYDFDTDVIEDVTDRFRD